MVYVDTSVLVPLFLNDPHSVAVATWYARENGELVAAAWCAPEFASALGIKQRAGAALHLACAEAAGAKHMATLNDALSRKSQRLKIKPVVLRKTP